MSDESQDNSNVMTIPSSRFGELEVAADSIITVPSGLIGFPNHKQFVMIEHKHPFCWLHSTEDPGLAFVVVDGSEFGENYHLEPPIGEKDADIQPEDEYAILVVVTVRPDPTQTTANLKAPVFVNLRNRNGVQVIFDNPSLTTRFTLFQAGSEEISEPQATGGGQGSKSKE
jgi:flagellar assembly factor FliW